MNIENQEQKELSTEERRAEFFREIGNARDRILSARTRLKPREFKDFYRQEKNKMKKNFPEFEKITDVIFGIREFVNRNDNVNHHTESLTEEQKRKDIIDMCTWQRDETEVLIEFGWNKRAVDSFWYKTELFFKIFSQYHNDFEGVKQGVTGQARAFLVLKELGYEPRLAPPEEDAMGVDFYISSPERHEELISQIKMWKAAGRTTIDLVEIGSPGLTIDYNNKTTRIQEARMAEISKLRAACGEISRKVGRQIRSLLIILNEHDFSDLTGKPKPEFLERIKAELSEKLK